MFWFWATTDERVSRKPDGQQIWGWNVSMQMTKLENRLGNYLHHRRFSKECIVTLDEDHFMPQTRIRAVELSSKRSIRKKKKGILRSKCCISMKQGQNQIRATETSPIRFRLAWWREGGEDGIEECSWSTDFAADSTLSLSFVNIVQLHFRWACCSCVICLIRRVSFYLCFSLRVQVQNEVAHNAACVDRDQNEQLLVDFQVFPRHDVCRLSP